VEEQLKKGIEIISRNCGAQAFIAYFQDETSTAGDLNYLQDQYERAINYTGIKGLAISTRPDQVDEQVGRILSNLEKPVSLEIGMQSRHESSLGYLQRGHTHTDTINALRLCEEYEIEAGVHLMIGIPGEELEDILSTIKWVSAQKVICEVKLHNLVIYHGTKLAEMWQQGLVRQMPIDEYIEQLTEVLGWLREDIVVSRLFTSNILHNDLAVVKQEGNKPKWLNRLKNRLLDKSYRQGCLLGGQIIIDGNTG
jgi:radical SAM protein (TIGR01212 family)